MWAAPLPSHRHLRNPTPLQQSRTIPPQQSGPPQPSQGHHAHPIAADTKPGTTGQKSMGLTMKATVIPQETHRTLLHLQKGAEHMCKRAGLLTTRTTSRTIESLPSLAYLSAARHPNSRTSVL